MGLANLYAVIVAGSVAAAAPQPGAPHNAPEALALMVEKAAVASEGALLVQTLKIAIEVAPRHARMLADRAIAAAPDRAGEIRVALGLVLNERHTPVRTETRVAALHPVREDTGGSSVADRARWEREISLGGSFLSGNTKERALSAGFKADYLGDTWEHHIALDGDYSRNRGRTTKERLLVDIDTKWFALERGYIFGLMDYESDRFSEFTWRLSEALGAGYRAVDLGRMTLDLEAGPGARQTKLDDNGVENEFIFTARSKYDWHIRDNLRFENVTSVFLGSDRTTVTNNARFTAGFTDHLSGRISVHVKHDTAVPLGQEQTNTATRASLVYGF